MRCPYLNEMTPRLSERGFFTHFFSRVRQWTLHGWDDAIFNFLFHSVPMYTGALPRVGTQKLPQVLLHCTCLLALCNFWRISRCMPSILIRPTLRQQPLVGEVLLFRTNCSVCRIKTILHGNIYHYHLRAERSKHSWLGHGRENFALLRWGQKKLKLEQPTK